MTHSDATGSYQTDFLEHILDTNFLYGVPYKIDREKYEAAMKAFNKEIRIHDADVVVFHADYNQDEDKPERGIYNYAFFAWPKNSPEGSDDFYDCSQFWVWDYKDKHKETFEEFVHELLKSVIDVDKQCFLSLINNKTMEREKITCEIEVLKQML